MHSFSLHPPFLFPSTRQLPLFLTSPSFRFYSFVNLWSTDFIWDCLWDHGFSTVYWNLDNNSDFPPKSIVASCSARRTVTYLGTGSGETLLHLICASGEQSRPFRKRLLWAPCFHCNLSPGPVCIGVVHLNWCSQSFAGLQSSQRRMFKSIYMRCMLYLAVHLPKTWVIPQGCCSVGLIVTYRWGSGI